MRGPATPRPSTLTTPTLSASPLFARTFTASPLSMSDSEAASHAVRTPSSLLLDDDDDDDDASIFADLRVYFDHELRNSLAPDAPAGPLALRDKYTPPPSPCIPLLVTAPSPSPSPSTSTSVSTSTTTAVGDTNIDADIDIDNDNADTEPDSDDAAKTTAQLMLLVATSTPLTPLLRHQHARNTQGAIGDGRPEPLLPGSEVLGPADTRASSGSSGGSSSTSAFGAVGDGRLRRADQGQGQGQGEVQGQGESQGPNGDEAEEGARTEKDEKRTRTIRFSDALVRSWLVWDVQRREAANPNLARWRELGEMMAAEWDVCVCVWEREGVSRGGIEVN